MNPRSHSPPAFGPEHWVAEKWSTPAKNAPLTATTNVVAYARTRSGSARAIATRPTTIIR